MANQRVILDSYIFPNDIPDPEQDGRVFLLRFAGRQWATARWGEERQKFYYESGDYLDDVDFEWFELPE